MTPTLRWSLLVAGEAALVLFLLTFGNTFTGSVPLHRTHLAILGLLGLLGWLVILTRPSRLPTILVVAPLPLLAALAVTSIWSPYPSLSWYATWQCAAYIGIAWLLAMQAGHSTGRRNLIAAIGIVVTIVAVVYLVQVGFAWVEWLSLGFPVSSLPLRPLGSGGLILIPTWVPDVIALGAPVVVASLWIERQRAPAVALAVISSGAVILSGTRSVLLLIVVLSIVAVAFAVRGRASRRVALVGWISMATIAVACIGVVVLASRSFDEGRSSAYASAIDRFGSSPIAGTGPGTYAVLRMGDSVDVLSHLAFPDAHNIVLTAAAESGVIGLVALGLVVAGYALATRRAWATSDSRRGVVAAAVFGLAVVGGHAMVDVVFALIGVLLLVLAALALATTDPLAAHAPETRRPWRLRALLLVGFGVMVLTTGVLVRNEASLDAVVEADRSLPNAPVDALAAARRATDLTSDGVPGWWVRMVAADATGDPAEAIGSARRTVDLEGFGQEWLALAILEARSGDAATARDAIDQATGHTPLDPVVELNATLLYAEGGAMDAARAAAARLLRVQPDIEPVLRGGPSGLQTAVASARRDAAEALLAGGDLDSAMLTALSGEDPALADAVLDSAPASGSEPRSYWEGVIAAWFGDEASRASHDAAVTADPTPSAIMWSWRLAGRACDAKASDRWERALEIGAGRHPVTPTTLGSSPGFQVRLLPSRYPGVVWRMDHPERPYVAGVWTFELDRPICAR